MGEGLDISWVVFKAYAFYTSILMLKLISLSFLSAALQYRRKIVFNKEDLHLFRGCRLGGYDEDILRTHRAQDDDVKNIVPFCILGLIYCFTHPSPAYATTVFQVFTAARFLHSFVYVVCIIRQPARAVTWSIGTLMNMYMCFKIFFYFIFV